MNNIRITSIQSQAGARGDGERVFAPNTIVVPIPAMLKDPSSHRRTTDRSQGIESDALIVVSREALRSQGNQPSVGDRVGFVQTRLGAIAKIGDIVNLRELEGDTKVEMALKTRLDNAEVQS
ncbi:hypothetical protein COB72_03450 [bacterium]|nr:MAG: hypothetical protein COB72_03450 [bacterium]